MVMVKGQFYMSTSTVRYKDRTEVTFRVLRYPGADEVSVHDTEEEAKRIIEFANKDVMLLWEQHQAKEEEARHTAVRRAARQIADYFNRS